MQLHSSSYTLPWHTTDSSDLSMQWAQLPRPYSSTDQSSSLGSMESLDTPAPNTQPYSGSHNSPVDPTIFNNKRDSAYSSFSASSNTSDCTTMPLRPGEVFSMDNFFQSLGPACQNYPDNPSTLRRPCSEAPDLTVYESRSLTRPRPRPVEIKDRPSSCCYEQEQKGGHSEILRNVETRMERKNSPPQPPTRKDSFRATQSHTDAANKCCTSAPIEDCNVSYYEKDKSFLISESVIQNVFSALEEINQHEDLQIEDVESHFVQRQTDGLQHIRCDSGARKDYKSETTSGDLPDSVAASESPIIPSGPQLLYPECSMEIQIQTNHSSTKLHRNSTPEKLLATQLQLLQFNSNNSSVEPCNTSNLSDSPLSPWSSQWSHSSSVHPTTNNQEAFHNQLPSNIWSGSRCSTPGSVLEAEDGVSTERLEGNINGGSLSLVNYHMPWGRSMSVPGEPTRLSPQVRLSPNEIVESDFQPLSAAVSVNMLPQEQAVVERSRCGLEKEENVKKSNLSKNYRRNRRHSERFATNLRNEIQRKKAQIQRSHGPRGLLCSRETVKEEEGSDPCEEETDSNLSQKKCTKVAFASPAVPQDSQTSSQIRTSSTSSKSNCDILQTQSTTYAQNSSRSRSVQILNPGVHSFGAGIRVVEEPAPAGKGRRWRWTPEHKLQPELDGDRQIRVSGERVLGVTESRHGVCTFTSSSSSSYNRSSSNPRTEESDILPFADRMKFFEETCREMSVSNASSVSSYRQKKTEHHSDHQAGELGQHSTRKRYSYQGGVQNVQLPNTMEARKQSVSAIRERQKEIEREQFSDMEEKRERLREMERQQEIESQERELEMECTRQREIQREREREERMRQWEREKEKKREENFQLTSYKECYGNSGIRERDEDFEHKEHFYNCQSKPPMFSHNQTQNQVPQSAFYPVNHHLQPLENHQPLHQRYTVRSYTPTEAYQVRQQETTKLNRKYSLTERGYPSWRKESRPPQNFSQQQHRLHQAQWDFRWIDSSGDEQNSCTSAPLPAPLFLRGRAMSENDLHFESSHCWSPSFFSATSQMLSKVEEGENSTSPARASRKKAPPRPPPPKLEQFHRRRASHHTLLSSSSFSAAASLYIPATFNNPEAQSSACSSTYVPPPETSRQRSYSLPPERQEVIEVCPRCNCSQIQTQKHMFSHTLSNQIPAQVQEHPFTVVPPSPMFSSNMFRPVAPPNMERPDTPPSPPAGTTVSSSHNMDMSHSLDQDRVLVKPHKPQLNIKPEAEWERTPSPRVRSNTTPSRVLENGSVRKTCPAESYFSQRDVQQQVCMKRDLQEYELKNLPEPGPESELTLSLSLAHSLEADLELPLETDIDDFLEELPAEDVPLTSELPCFAQPVTILDTDIDQVLDPESLLSGETPAESSCREELETEKSCRERLSLEEMFPQSSERESGAFQPAEHNTDSLDRQSTASSSCSSYYQTSAAKAQLLSQMKDVTQSRKRDEDDELTYKKQLMESLRKKLGVLREAQRGLQEDIRANSQLGEEVENLVVSVCKPNEVDKYCMFIGDLDKVVSLMLSLSGRLLRVEMTLDMLDPETEQHERLSLLEKKCQLMRQLSEAQDLKDHVDRREQAVSRVLARCLTPEQHRDYRWGFIPILTHSNTREYSVTCFQAVYFYFFVFPCSHFVKMKAALLVEQRQLEDKIRLGEEQLRGLRESLGLGLGMAMGMGMLMGYGHY
uniref:Protein Shroom4-like n=1 Tax=Kryptolebias marmoratus TaxID=37003 RepID=A0A3Q2ZN62_KRYMA